MTITLDYAAPAEALRDCLSVWYEFRADVPVFADVERADYAQLRFTLAGRGGYRFADGHEAAAPPIAIIGPTTGDVHLRVEGPVLVFGAGILPAGWGALIGSEASALVNRVLDATRLFGPAVEAAARALATAPTLADKVAIGDDLIAALVKAAPSVTLHFTKKVDAWLADDPSPCVEALVAALGISRRQVERRCNQLYGAPPKLLARKYRALRAAVALARGEATMDAVIGESFYDQSHFIREIKAFTGLTPTHFAEDLPTLARLTLKRAELAGQVEPIIYRT